MDVPAALAKSALFAGIAPEDIPGLLSCLNGRERIVRKGETLLERGSVTGSIGLVMSGAVQIFREDFWGNRSVVGLAGPGEIFAEAYALEGETLEVSVQAAAPGSVLFLDAERMVSGCTQVCSFHAQLTRNLMKMMAAKNRNLTEKIRHMSRRTTREKLMSYLSARALQAGSAEFDIPLDRQQLADYLGVERSAMSAALGKLRDEGVLTVWKNHFHLLKREED